MKTVGIDEVGRGCWAGPLVAAAVLLEKPIAGLRDSKKLTRQQRESLAAQIEIEALAVGIQWIWPATIDKIGLTESVRTAMTGALMEIQADYDEVVVDGNLNYLSFLPKTHSLIKADDIIPAVSAASIIAKVARDKYMEKLALELPNYGFDRHVGYGTAAHRAALQAHGVTSYHRKSYKPVQALMVQ
jgi:ribonuclease HII